VVPPFGGGSSVPPSFATHMASQSTPNMNIRTSHGSASWMNQSGVPVPGPSGMSYGIGNGVSMQTGMASMTGNNGMFSGISSMPSGSGVPIYNHNTMMSNSGRGSMMSNGAGMMPTAMTSGGTTTLAPPGLFTSGLTGANLPPFEAFIEQLDPFGLFVLENYLKCKGNYWFQEPGLAARWNALTRREQEENACYFWNHVQERSKTMWNRISQEENLRIYGLSASIKAVATQAHLLNKRMVGVLENDRLTFSLQSISNNPNNTVPLYENVPQQPTPTRSAFTASAYTDSVSSADEAQNTPTSNRTRFKEVKSVETMTDNVLQVCNTCGNAMGVDLIHSRGEVEVIDLADATQPPVTTGARPGNPVARHLNEAQQHENVPLVNPPQEVPEENESGIDAGVRDDRNNQPNYPNRMPILDEMKMTDRAAEIEVQQILAQGNNAQQNRAVGGGKAVKRTACPRKVARKDGAGPSKKGGSPKGFKSAYTMFVTTEGPRIRQELRNRPEMEDNLNFSRYVGQLWRAMSDVEKEPFHKMSRDEYAKQQAMEEETSPNIRETPENELAQEMSAEDSRFRAYQTSAKVGSLRASTIANNMGPPRQY